VFDGGAAEDALLVNNVCGTATSLATAGVVVDGAEAETGALAAGAAAVAVTAAFLDAKMFVSPKRPFLGAGAAAAAVEPAEAVEADAALAENGPFEAALAIDLLAALIGIGRGF
jgi:hypothetical protein